MCMHRAPTSDMWSGKTKEMSIEQAFMYAGLPINPGAEQNEVMTPDVVREWAEEYFNDFIWISAGGNGVCTACRSEVSGVWAGHKEYTSCPVCGKDVEVRYRRYGHSKLKETFYAIHWRKSPADDKSVIMTGYFCHMDSSGPEPERAEKLIIPVQLDVFRYGKGAGRWQRPVWGYSAKQGEQNWHRCSEVRPIGKNYFRKKVDTVLSDINFREAIENTPFEGGFNAIEEALHGQLTYVNGDQSEIMAAIAGRPWIEYMIKSGFRKLGLACMHSLPKGLILPKRKHVREILRLSKDRYAEIKGKQMDIDTDTLQIIQSLDANKVRVKPEEAQEIAHKLRWYSWSGSILEIYGTPDRRLVKYLLRNDISALMDYWREAAHADIDMSIPEAKLPPNLREAHDRVLEINREARRQRLIDAAKPKEEKLEKRLDKLEKRYCFEHDGLVLRPARSLIELVDEGNALSHCVGGYTNSYANGNTDICFLRKAEEPDTPWRTIEFDPRTGRLIQDRGYKNDWAAGPGGKKQLTEDLKLRLQEFWRAFYENHPELKAV